MSNLIREIIAASEARETDAFKRRRTLYVAKPSLDVFLCRNCGYSFNAARCPNCGAAKH